MKFNLKVNVKIGKFTSNLPSILLTSTHTLLPNTTIISLSNTSIKLIYSIFQSLYYSNKHIL